MSKQGATEVIFSEVENENPKEAEWFPAPERQERIAQLQAKLFHAAAPPSLAVQMDGSYVPRNNLEEAILLLMILMENFTLWSRFWAR